MQPDFDFDRYNERLNELFSRFQSVQKVGFTENAYKPGLSGMERFSTLLGDPWRRYPCIHVAGTNGKGSVCSMLASSLAAAGVQGHADGQCRYRWPLAGHEPALCPARMASGGNASCCRIGLYTSPHLLDFRERMKIVSGDGFEMISREEVWEFLNSHEADFEGLSFFEITTGMAFWWFAKRGVDAAVIEVGLGGRLDSTNIITPVLSVVTSIGLDHCALLGSTRAEIAREKAGIFKPGVPAVVGIRDYETAPVFEEVASTVGAPLVFASDLPAFDFAGLSDSTEASILSKMDLQGPCQDINLHTVLTSLYLIGRFGRNIHENKDSGGCAAIFERPSTKTGIFVDAIAESGRRTGFMGRWQRISNNPEIICDIGHNPPALKENFARLEALAAGHPSGQNIPRQLIIVYGIMADKDLAGIAPLMPAGAKYILAAPDSPRSMPAKELTVRLHDLRPDLDLESASDVNDAVRQALILAQDLPRPLIYIGGSTFVVAEALPMFNKTTEA